jgi:hemerythrin-like metal-binding protein
LAEAMNRIYAAWQKGMRCPDLAHLLEELRVALVSHFSKEITIARGAGYGRWLAHHQEHKVFLGRFSDFMEECRDQGNSAQTNIEMFMELERHLFEHEVMSDQEMWGLWTKEHPAPSGDRLIDWKPEYAVGVEQIDGQHQRLVRLLNEVHQRLQDEKTPLPSVVERMRAIYLEALQHFRSEEQYFSQLPEPMAEQHRASHEGLIVELKRALDDNDTADLDRLKALTEGYLKFWLLDHIVNTDSRLRDYLK